MKKSELKTTELVCEKGLCLYNAPTAVSGHYPLICEKERTPEFTEIEIPNKPIADDNKKQCAKKLKIRAKFTFARLMQASVDLDYEKIGEAKAKETKKAKPTRR